MTASPAGASEPASHPSHAPAAPAAVAEGLPAPSRQGGTAAGGSHLDLEALMTCVHCGLCLSACPTYLQLGAEPDSPRGRIYLMRAVAEGRLEWTSEVVSHLDLCLECRACESACPSGVRYGQLLEMAREDIERHYRRPWRERVITGVLRDRILPYPHRLRRALAPVRVLQRLGVGQAVEEGRRPPVAQRLVDALPDDLKRLIDIMPPLPDSWREPLPAVVPAEGRRRYRVGFLAGCVGSVVFSETNWATLRVLARNGCEVVIPPQQGCCGALHLHTGAPDATRRFAAVNLEAFPLDDLDAIITNAAGCGSTLKEYGHVLANDERLAERAQAFSAKCRDISEFLAEIELVPPTHPVPRVVTYHDACHLAHGQGIRRQPRWLLEQIPQLKVVPLPDSELCCGSAGLYNILQPDMASRLLEKKINAILSTGADTVATGNPGCIMQIIKGLRERGHHIEVKHPVELLAESYGLNGRPDSQQTPGLQQQEG